MSNCVEQSKECVIDPQLAVHTSTYCSFLLVTATKRGSNLVHTNDNNSTKCMFMFVIKM